MDTSITDNDLDALRARFQGETGEEIDWALVALPPCPPTILRAAAEVPGCHAEIVRSYYNPELVTPDPLGEPGREVRRAGRQCVVVADDGTVLAT